MRQLHIGKWLPLAALLLIGCEGAPESDPWITPIPNLDAAMEGFDPIMSNPLERPDPGIRNKIFEPMRELPDGRVVVNSFIDKAREDLHCDAKLSGKTLRNYNEYNREKSSSHKFSSNADVSVKAGFWRFSFSASAGYGRESTGEERSVQKLFQETNGEIVESIAECITHSVGISLFEKPVFTAAFTTALRQLHFAAKTPDSASSRRTYVKFVLSYGTHFMTTTFLGAKFIFEKRFSSKTDDSIKEIARSECVNNFAYASLGVKVWRVEAASSSKMTSEGCESTDELKSFFQNNKFSEEKVISIGPLPHGGLENWSNTVKESPVPIYYELEKISSLFQSEWFNTITTDDTDSNAEKLNGTAMYYFFEDKSAFFCQLILGEKCDVDKKGCGYNSLCSKDESCVNDQTTDLGYTCNSMKNYGPVLMMGGYNSNSPLSSGDAIDTWTLPNLPYAASGVSLAAVGSEIYSCGGSRSGTGPTSSCYVLDRASHSPRWDSIASLPTSMSYHTSVTIKDHIWTVHSSKLYDLNTRANKFHTFHLPLTVSSGHCAVSNGSHSFIIGAGAGRNEIWVNTEEYNPAKWHRVGHLRTSRIYFGCLWFEQDVFITGGDPSRNDAVMFDTVSHVLRSAGTLVQGRLFNRMMVFEGKPAVVGGKHGTSAFIGSIETYDQRTALWTTSPRSLAVVRDNFGLAQLHG